MTEKSVNRKGLRVKKLLALCTLILLTNYGYSESQIYFVHSDHLGTPQKLTDANQTVVWEVESQTPFGEAIVDEDPDSDGKTVTFNLRFPGQYYDSETGLHYNYHRYYDPSLGRYLQSDPIGLDDGPNTYAYVGGNPINYYDPDGLSRRKPTGTSVTQGNLNHSVTTLIQQIRSYYPNYSYQSVGPARRGGGYNRVDLNYLQNVFQQAQTNGQCSRYPVIAVAPVRGSSRTSHRNSANQWLYNILTGSGGTNFGLPSGTANYMASGSGSNLRNPQNTQWHHPANAPGIMQLLNTNVHRNPGYQTVLHPGPGGSGGYSQFSGN